MKHSISTIALAQTGPVKFDFISLSLKPDRGNQVISSPTSLSLLVVPIVANSFHGCFTGAPAAGSVTTAPLGMDEPG